MEKTRLKIDLTIYEDKRMSGGIQIEGAAFVLISGKSPVLCEIIQKAAELIRRMNDENTAQND